MALQLDMKKLEIPRYRLQAIEAWLATHEVYPIDIDLGANKEWYKTINDSPNLRATQGRVYFPSRFKVNKHEYEWIANPNPNKQRPEQRFFIFGGMGSVGFYKRKDASGSIVVLKISPTEIERHAYEVMNFLQQNHLLGADTCINSLLKITAATSGTFSCPKNSEVSQSMLLLEVMDMDLDRFITAFPAVKTVAMYRSVIRSATQAIACLHNAKPPIAHGDIKPQNFLTSPHSNHKWIEVAKTLQATKSRDRCLPGSDITVYVKSSDFDVAFLYVWDPYNDNPVPVSTRFYTCPQRESDPAPSLPDDIWALGVTFYELVTNKSSLCIEDQFNDVSLPGRPPRMKKHGNYAVPYRQKFNEYYKQQDLLALKNHTMKTLGWSHQDADDAADFISMCLIVNLRGGGRSPGRATINDLLDHRFLKC